MKATGRTLQRATCEDICCSGSSIEEGPNTETDFLPCGSYLHLYEVLTKPSVSFNFTADIVKGQRY